MPAWLKSALKVVLTVAALVAVPVGTWLNGHPIAYSILEFVASLTALFLRSPVAPVTVAVVEPEPKLGNKDVQL